MNLKDRGITVGDLLIVLLLVISTLFIINKVKESNKEINFHLAPNENLTTQKN